MSANPSKDDTQRRKRAIAQWENRVVTLNTRVAPLDTKDILPKQPSTTAQDKKKR